MATAKEKILQATEGWSAEEAIEWIEYNTEGAYISDRQPIIMHRIEGVLIKNE